MDKEYAEEVLNAAHLIPVYANIGRNNMRVGVIVCDNHCYYTIRASPYWPKKAFGIFADEWTAMEKQGVTDIELVWKQQMVKRIARHKYRISFETAREVRIPRDGFAGGGYFIPMDALNKVTPENEGKE